MSYEKWEIAKNKKLIRENYFKGEENYDHFLKNTTLNLYDDIRGDKDDSKSVIHYFDTNNIVWHKNGGEPTGSTISSQVACLNHLFPIRNNYEAVREMVKNIDSRFEDVLEVKCGDVEEKEKTYIAFEVIGKNNLLDERGRKRGMVCTSIDALIRAKEKEGEICIILIEWKYTESYNRREDKSDEGKTGKNRMQRYNKLIQKSLSLIPLCEMDMSDDYYGGAKEYKGSVYYQEPFYELMRQTLWAELFIGRIENDTAKISGEEPIKASDYFHLLVVSNDNKALLDMGFDGVGNTMEETWRNCLTEKGKKRFKIMSPEELFEPFIKQEASIKIPDDFIGYLKTRYWRNDLKKDFESAVNKTKELVNHRDCKDGTKGWAKIFKVPNLNKKI
ncbi:MAG: hypothetical protein LUD72_03625, partial [Bacteroidales bacterium]|nr:hypothetical protein [Bacteroidales bacterium]